MPHAWNDEVLDAAKPTSQLEHDKLLAAIASLLDDGDIPYVLWDKWLLTLSGVPTIVDVRLHLTISCRTCVSMLTSFPGTCVRCCRQHAAACLRNPPSRRLRTMYFRRFVSTISKVPSALHSRTKCSSSCDRQLLCDAVQSIRAARAHAHPGSNTTHGCRQARLHLSLRLQKIARSRRDRKRW